jgi:hypothetical protein
MAKPTSRQGLIDYCLRQLGAPVLEVNVAQEQIEDLVDDAIQYFNERHFNGVTQLYLKYKITDEDVARGEAGPPGARGKGQAGITTTSVTKTIVGTATTFNYYENSNYIQLPESVVGVNKVFQYSDLVGTGMFSMKYQLMLNDVMGLNGMMAGGGYDLTSYSMTMSYLETMNFLLNTHKQIRFNQRANRMYLDIDWGNLKAGRFIIIDCWGAMDPATYDGVWNDVFLKKYLTALIKKQWGQNLIKFQGVKLPGGIEFNGRQIYDDAMADLDKIQDQMLSTYELPPLDLIG